MGKEKFKNKYRIASARLKGYDYSSTGGYYLTIVTQDREHFFGKIVNGKMVLSEIGKIAQKYWDEIPQHFPFIKLDEMVVMPNHIHGILWIDKLENTMDDVPDGGMDDMPDGGMDDVPDGGMDDMPVGGMDDVPVGGMDDVPDGGMDDMPDGGMDDVPVGGMDDVPVVETLHATSLRQKQSQLNKNIKMAKISPKPGSLSTLIRSFKSVVTKNSRKINRNFKWQPRFHDRIIRNNEELNRIQNYIINNPIIWERDRNNR